MTLESAKEFYFQYNGFSFHMDREEPAKYGSFRLLNIGKDTLSQWDQELLDGLFAGFWSEPDRVWTRHGTILQIIRRNYCDAATNLSRLLDEMEKMKDLPLLTMTLIIENMAGRNEPMTDGGVYTICRLSNFAGRMNAITERLIEACAAKHETDERFEKAVSRYRSAYRKWSR